MRSRFFHCLAVIILAGGWSSCKDDPVSPPEPPVVNKTDTIRHTLSITPDSSATILIHSSPVIKLSATPILPKPYTILWTIDSQTQSRTSLDTLTFKFDAGSHYSIKAVYIDSTGSRRDSVQSIARVKDTTVLPGDTSSHEFVWQEFTSVGGENDMTGCWVFGSNDIWTVNGDIHHFDGTSWSTAYQHTGGGLSGYSIFGFSDNDLWLIGNSQPAHYLGNGSIKAYSTYYLNHGRVYSAWGLSSNDLYVVGDSGLVAHFDGSNWTKMATPTTKSLHSISGISNNDIWACGYDPLSSETILLHYDGATWTEDQLSLQGLNAIGGFCGVWACDSASSSFVTASGSLLARKTGSSSWRIDTLDNKAGSQYLGMFFASGNTTNDFMTVADGGFITHWNGRSWHRYDSYFAPGNFSYVTNGFAMRGNTACVVGIKNGTSWVLIGQRK